DSTFFQIRALVIQADDKVIGVDNSVFRFNNADGSLDTTFRQPDLLIDRSANGANGLLLAEAFTINLRSDGRILIGGDFSDIDDAPPLPANGERWGVAEFNSDGTLDSFTTSHRQAYNAYPTSFLRLANGLTLIGFNQTGSLSGHSVIRHNYGRLLPNGSLDISFDPLASLPNGPVTALGFAVLPNGNIFGWGTRDATGNFTYGVVLPDGTVADPNYTDDPNVGFDKAYPLTNGQVLVLISSGAQAVLDNTELRRINSNGSLDTSFVLDPSVLANTVQRDMSGNLQTIASGFAVLAVRSDGRILFAYLAADRTCRLVRLNPNGSLDSTFQAASVPVSTTSSFPLVADPQGGHGNPEELFPDGVPGFSGAQLVTGNQLIVVGQFASYAGVPAHGIVRLNANGTVDATFHAGNGAQWTHTTQTATFHPSVDNIEQAGNGKLLITGTFEAFNSVALPGIALLNPNGSVDPLFTPPAVRQKFDYHTAYLAKQPDNSFLLSGPYSLPNQTQSPSFIHIFGAPVITSPATATATQGQLFVYQITASGTPTSYAAAPLPAGLTFDSFSQQTGILSGTPTSPGTTQIHLTASNSFGTGMKTLTLTVHPFPSSGPVIASGTSIT
ncbi:MAG: putative Ig domain-containing protein, partial [Chthoniobacterales bacterium]